MGKGMQVAEEDFNRRNKGNTVKGKPLTFDSYIHSFNQMNYNYGLKSYSAKKLLAGKK